MREYGIIRTSLWESERWERLRCNEARLIYFFLHTSGVCNAVGCYRLSMKRIAVHLNISMSSVKDGLHKLVCVGLIDYDFDREYVRINLFMNNSPCKSKKHAFACVNALADIDHPEFLRKTLHDVRFDNIVMDIGGKLDEKITEIEKFLERLENYEIEDEETHSSFAEDQREQAAQVNASCEDKPFQAPEAPPSSSDDNAHAFNPLMLRHQEPDLSAEDPLSASHNKFLMAADGFPVTRTRRKKSPLAEDWRPGEATCIQITERYGCSLMAIAKQIVDFRHYWIVEKPTEKKVDWNKAFFDWVERSATRRQLIDPTKNPTQSKAEGRVDETKRVFEQVQHNIMCKNRGIDPSSIPVGYFENTIDHEPQRERIT